MALDARKNFCITQALQGYSESDTAISAVSGGGGEFPDTTVYGDYNLVWFNSTDYSNPALDPDAEIIRVTHHTAGSDAFTVGRGQESTNASEKNIAGKVYTLMLAPTSKMFDDIETELNSKQAEINFIDEEIVSGSGTNWVLDETPIAGCIPALIAQGSPLTVGANDFSISGKNITTSLGYPEGTLIARYRY